MRFSGGVSIAHDENDVIRVMAMTSQLNRIWLFFFIFIYRFLSAKIGKFTDTSKFDTKKELKNMQLVWALDNSEYFCSDEKADFHIVSVLAGLVDGTGSDRP